MRGKEGKKGRKERKERVEEGKRKGKEKGTSCSSFSISSYPVFSTLPHTGHIGGWIKNE